MVTPSNRLMFLIALFISGGLAAWGTAETQCIWDNGKAQCFTVVPDSSYKKYQDSNSGILLIGLNLNSPKLTLRLAS